MKQYPPIVGFRADKETLFKLEVLRCQEAIEKGEIDLFEIIKLVRKKIFGEEIK